MIHRLILTLALVTCAPIITGCSGNGAKDAHAYVEQGAAFAYNGAVVALELLDAREAASHEKLDSSMTAELEAAELRVQRLERARDALAIVRAWLTKERTEEDARAAMKDAIGLLLLAVEETKSQGVNLPQAVTDGLAVAAAWAGAS